MIFSYSCRGSLCNFTALKQSPDGRGERRRGGSHADPFQGVLEALLGQSEAGQLIFHAPN
jgi:hypothetical protein